MKKILYMSILFLLLTSSSQGMPWRRILMGVRAARTAKKMVSKKNENKKNELAKLRARYPAEMTEIDKLQSKDPDTAQQKLVALAKKYEKETGERLKVGAMSKKSESKGLLRRISKGKGII